MLTKLQTDNGSFRREPDRRYDSESRVEGSGDVIVDWML